MINIIIDCIILIYNWFFEILRRNGLLVIKKTSKPKLTFLKNNESDETDALFEIRSDIHKLFERITIINQLESSICSIDSRLNNIICSRDPFSFEYKLNQLSARIKCLEKCCEDRKIIEDSINQQLADLTIRLSETNNFVNIMNDNVTCLKKILFSLTGRTDDGSDCDCDSESDH